MDKELFEILSKYDTTQLADGANEFVSLDSEIKPINNKMKVIGSAYTVKLVKGDSSIIFEAIEKCSSGDVLIIDSSMTYDTAVWGDSKSLAAKLKGLAGVVINGAYRDRAGCLRENFPVFAKYLVVHGSGSQGLGTLNEKISIGNIEIRPKDIIIGDENGVIVLKPEKIQEIVERADKKWNSDKKRKISIREKYSK